MFVLYCHGLLSFLLLGSTSLSPSPPPSLRHWQQFFYTRSSEYIASQHWALVTWPCCSTSWPRVTTVNEVYWNKIFWKILPSCQNISTIFPKTIQTIPSKILFAMSTFEAAYWSTPPYVELRAELFTRVSASRLDLFWARKEWKKARKGKCGESMNGFPNGDVNPTVIQHLR